MPIERVDAISRRATTDRLEHEATPSVEKKSEHLTQRILAVLRDSYQAFRSVEAKHQQYLLAHPHAYAVREDYSDIPDFKALWTQIEQLPHASGYSPVQCLGVLITWWRNTPHEDDADLTSAKEHFFRFAERKLKLFEGVFGDCPLEQSLPLFAQISTTPILASTITYDRYTMGENLIARKMEIIPLLEKGSIPDQVRIATVLRDTLHSVGHSSYGIPGVSVLERTSDVDKIIAELVEQARVSHCSQMVTYLLEESRAPRDWLGHTESMNTTAKNFRVTGEITTASINVISRDAIACSDSDGSILSIGLVDTSRVSDRAVPSSSSIEIVAEGYEVLKKDPYAMVDPTDLYQIYEEDIQEYLSPEEQDQFEEVLGNSVKTREMCNSLLKKFNYTVVSCESVEKMVTRLEMRGDSSEEDVTLLFQQLHKPEIRRVIEADLGLTFAALSLREQAQLLRVICFSEKSRYKRFSSALREQGEALAICLLSCEESMQVADHLLEIAETFPLEQAQRLFSHCSKSLRNAVKTAQQIEEEVFSGSKSTVTRKQVEDVLFTQVIKTIDQITQATLANHPVDEAIHSLERANPDMLLLAAVTKTSIKGREKETTLAELKDVSLHSYRINELPLRDREHKLQEYKQILEENWASRGAAAFMQALHGLEEGFEQPATRFFELRIKDQLVAFLRFDERPDLGDGALYAGSFNTVPTLKGSALGSLFFHEVLRSEGRDCEIFAHVLATDPVASVYVEEFDFSIVGLERDSAADGSQVPWFRIARAPNGRKQGDVSSVYLSSSSTDRATELLEWVDQQTQTGAHIIRYAREKGSSSVRMTSAINAPEMLVAA